MMAQFCQESAELKRKYGIAVFSCMIIHLLVVSRALANGDELRILHFPEKTSLGTLYCYPADWSVYKGRRGCRKVGEARGTVRVPQGARLLLHVGYAAAQNPSLLTAYGADFFAGLEMGKVETDDTTINKISELTGLQSLDLRESELTDQGVIQLSKLKNLEELNLGRTDVTDKGAVALAVLRSLNDLTLNQTRISDNALKSIQKCRNISRLYLSDCHLTDAGLPSIASLTQLTQLILDGNKGITATGLLQLSSLKSLKRLYVRDTAITAKDLKAIEKLKKEIPALNFISLNDKSFTPLVVSQWQAALRPVAVEVRGSDIARQDPSKIFGPLHSWSDH